jgi:probable F420-dependent oxidoreductase
MKIDTTIMGSMLDDGSRARAAEELGFDGVWVAETGHDPMLAMGAAAARTSRVSLGTNILVAFARSPMTVAMTANDLHLMSEGRFILGLGSQIKPHITRRFGMPWSAPAARMKEYVGALRAIWRSWHEGEPLKYEGEFYQFTLMTPMFSPGPSQWGPPPIYLAGVGERMVAASAEVADGLLVHPFTTERYLKDVIVPSLKAVCPDLDGFVISGMPIVVTGADEQAQAKAADAARMQIAFYASTPAYKPILDVHGWGELYDVMHDLSLKGDWGAMGQHIDDEVLRTIAIVAEPEQIAAELEKRFGGVMTRCALSTREGVDPAMWEPVLRRVSR